MSEFIDLTKYLKAGDPVWTILNEKLNFVSFELGGYTIRCSDGIAYTSEGKKFIDDEHPFLFLKNPNINYEYEPEPEIEVKKEWLK